MEMVHFIPPSQRHLTMLATQAEHVPVLICGAGGTGKGAIAKWIHKNGPRAGQVILEASRHLSLQKQLMEAQGGTLVIPEIGHWPLSIQKTLEEYLKVRSVSQPNGLPMILNVRVIALSSLNLKKRTQGGLFNPELLRLLSEYKIEMPNLSKRSDEFEDIAHGLLGEITRELDKEHIREFSTESMSTLKRYPWPGNLRELRNVLRVAAVSCQTQQIELSDLPEFGPNRVDFRATREEFEKTYLMELLRTFNWEVDKTCEVSRIEPEALRAKIQKYQIPMPQAGNHPAS